MPSFSMASAPAPPSSAGWKMTATEPLKLRVSARYCSSTQKHGGMPVMAAGMGLARDFRSPRLAAGLEDRQRVHVGTETDCRAVAVPPLDDADHAGLADAGLDHVAAEGCQFFGHELRCFVDIVKQLRVFMQMAPPARQRLPAFRPHGSISAFLFFPFFVPRRVVGNHIAFGISTFASLNFAAWAKNRPRGEWLKFCSSIKVWGLAFQKN